MKFYFLRIDPVQEVAAEPATLDLLRDILRPKIHEPRATPEFLTAAQMLGWPLVHDETIPPGEVHCRPTPGAPPPMSVEKITEYMRALMPGRRDGGQP
ncbi:hypothetical protein [Streptomyces kaempferi]|uniref:Uncharacterized protein n=1 Tax=Streptomyces kaempferi TaxID=333725 RepID=A0ABW3XW62_9ACTN